ncbi:MAG TPA: hypothetical protein VK283_00100, partial [Acidimicrobiales bacterium]|nr:hypothetical protein [Acidimicrobiales bacterium]
MSVTRRSRGLSPVLACVLVASALLALGTPRPAGAAAVQAGNVHAVGITTETYVDTTRPTAAWGPTPSRPTRTLVTTILYPAQGATSS